MLTALTIFPTLPPAYRKVTIKGVSSVSICPSDKHGTLLAAFIPEAKGSPAAAGIYDYSKDEPHPLVRKSFFRTQGKEDGEGVLGKDVGRGTGKGCWGRYWTAE